MSKVTLMISNTNKAQPTGPEPNFCNNLPRKLKAIKVILPAVIVATLRVACASALEDIPAIFAPILGKSEVIKTSVSIITPSFSPMSFMSAVCAFAASALAVLLSLQQPSRSS